MKTWILVALTFASSYSFASVKGDLGKIDKNLQTCLDKPENQNTVGMKACTAQADKSADDVLNAVYRQITTNLKKTTGQSDLDKTNAEMLKRLVDSEKVWVDFRDKDSNLQGISMIGGTGEGLIVLNSLYEMTKSRALELDNLFNDPN